MSTTAHSESARTHTRPQPQSAKPRFRWRRWILGSLAGLLLFVWLIPILIAHTPLLPWAVERGTVDLKGSAKIGGASLGWFSPIVLKNVALYDEQQRAVLEVPRVASEKTLLGLLLNLSDLGTFRIEGPSIKITMTGQDSNLEQLFSAYLTPSKETTESTSLDGTGLEIDVSDATLAIEQPEHQRTWTATQVAASVIVPKNGANPMLVKLSCQWADHGQTGKLDTQLSMHKVPQDAAPPASAGNLNLQITAFPLWVLDPLIHRSEPAAQLDGQLTTQLECAWGRQTQAANAPANDSACDGDFHVKGLIAVDDVSLAGPWLGQDQLRFARLEMPCDVASRNGTIRVQGTQLGTDVGQIKLSGALDAKAELAEAFQKANYELTADIDLARLATMLPGTIRLQQDTQITSGRLHLEFSGTPTDGGAVWKGQLKTTDLTANKAGQKIDWREPVAISLAAHQPSGKLPVLDELRCVSSFLQLEAAGSLDHLEATARCDLGRLRGELSRLVDLGEVQMAGDGWAHLLLRRAADGELTAQGQMQLKQLRLSGMGPHELEEPHLGFELALVGRGTAEGIERIDTAGLRIEGASDLLEIELLAPVLKPAEGPYGPLRFLARGDVTLWLARLRSSSPAVEGMQLAGSVELSGKLKGSADAVDIEGLHVVLKNLRGQASGLYLNEQAIDLSGAAHCQVATQKITLTAAKLTSSMLAIETPRLDVHFPEKGSPRIEGDALFGADLARLMAVLEDPAKPAGTMSGAVTGEVKFLPASEPTAEINLAVEQFVLGTPQDPTWQEPSLALAARCAYDLTADSLSVERAKLTAHAVSCDASGTIAGVRGAQDMKLTGTLHSDMEKLSKQLRPYLGEGVSAAGQDSRPFHFEGSLTAFLTGQTPPVNLAQPAKPVADPKQPLARQGFAALSAEAALPWKSAALHGFRLGPADLQAQLLDGWLVVKPLDIATEGGRIHLEPALRLEPGPWEIVHPKGTIIDKVQLTPQMCAGAIQFVAPVLAGATEASGQFSLSLEGARVPVEDPTRASISGSLAIHSVQVRGTALLFELMGQLLERPLEAQIAPNSTVAFQMAEGRVYHRDLVVLFPGFSVRTSGSVGTDGSLALVADMPIPPKWAAAAGKAGVALPDQLIRIPIGGTLKKPQMDALALRNSQAEFIRNTAGGVIQNQLNKGLNRLLGPK